MTTTKTRSPRRTTARRTPLVVGASAVLGASLALGAGAVGVGGGGGTTTVTQPAAATQVATRDVANTAAPSASAIYASASPSVVQVTAQVTSSSSSSGSDPYGSSGSGATVPGGAGGDDPYGSGGYGSDGSGSASDQTAEAIGSGFVVDTDGTILTNYHVVEGATSVKVTLANGSSRRTVTAKVLGTDASIDVAALKIDPSGLGLKALPLGSSTNAKVGDGVLAIGNPYGLDQTLTTGVVSAKGRTITSPSGAKITDAIQTDAAINEGSSGGPLLNADGEVVGINSQIATSGTSTGNLGIGFAVPIETVRKKLAAIEAGSGSGSSSADEGSSTPTLNAPTSAPVG